MDVARYRLEHNIEFSALSEKGKKYFNLEAYAQELEETGRYALSATTVCSSSNGGIAYGRFYEYNRKEVNRL